jgi:dCTP deaminase
MRLSDTDIEFYRRTGHIDITPWDDDSLQAASYDVHLACYVREAETNHGDEPCDCADGWYWSEPIRFDEDCRGNLTYTLAPNAFVLMSTVENVWVSPSLSATIAGKSSRAREGIQIESAGFIDPGFQGELTLEVKNMLPYPIVLTAGMPIAQVVFDLLRTPARRPYGERGHYMNQSGPTTSWESK